MKQISRYFAMLMCICMMCAACGAQHEAGVYSTAADVTGEPTTEESTTEAPTTEEPTTEEPTIEESTTEKPTMEESTTEEPTTEEPTTEAPTEAQPTEPVNLHTEETQVAGEGIIQVFETGKTLLADLDGDGEAEKITVAVDPDRGYRFSLKLQIDDTYYDCDTLHSVLRGLECEETRCFYLLDIDSSDKWLELAFFEYGPSGDPCTTFARYSDGELVYIGEIGDGPPGEDRYGNVSMEFPGDGTISAIVRYDKFQTDFTRKNWKLVNGSELNAQLEEIVPEYYEFYEYLDRWEPHVQLAQNATFYREKIADMENVIMLSEGTMVELFRYYPADGWLEILYEEGTKSVWLQVNEEGLFMPMKVGKYDYFTGLSAAD